MLVYLVISVLLCDMNTTLSHYVNKKYFSTINRENSYWAGFIAADGHLKKYDLHIGLTRSDHLHLEKFKNAIQFDGIIFQREQYNETYNKIYYSSHLVVNGDYGKLNDDLFYNFNIPRGNKSLILTPPIKLIQEDEIRFFIRGYMDGDGCIHKRKDNIYDLTFCGTKEILLWIKNQFVKFVNTGHKSSIITSGNIFQIHFVGYKTKLILDWLYKDSNNELRLERKHDLYLDVCVIYKNGPRTTVSGYTNITWHPQSQKFRLRITIDGKRKSFGLFASKEEALIKYKEVIGAS